MRSGPVSKLSALFVMLSTVAACRNGNIGTSTTGAGVGGGNATSTNSAGVGGSPATGTGGSPATGTGGSSSTGISCMGTIGTVCGSLLGLDPNTLYNCNGGPPMVASTCKGTCIHNATGDDACPCPNGDGTYCGSAVGLAADTLFDCQMGKMTPKSTCASGCNTTTNGTDACKACQFGNGLYCGQTVNQDPMNLYMCTNGVLSVQQHCPSNCQMMPPGVNDTCGPCPVGNGLYCGFEVGADPNTLYDCQNGVLNVQTHCPSTCHQAPNGVNDYCNGTGQLSCSSLQWWNVALTYGPYQIHNGAYTWWDTDLAVSNNTPVQLRHDSLLVADPVEPWGWEPQFIDMATGQRFQFLHLHPQQRYTTAVNTVYPAGTIVGLSGGGTTDTGYGTYSTGPHLCVETIAPWLTAFPKGQDPCH